MVHIFHTFVSMEVSLPSTAAVESSHCLAQLHMFACHPTPRYVMVCLVHTSMHIQTDTHIHVRVHGM